MSIAEAAPSAPLLRQRNFCLFLLGRTLWTLASQFLSVAIGWQVYAIAHTPASLGYVGLAQFLPVILLALPAGDLIDRLDRRVILIGTYLLQAVCAALFLALTLAGMHELMAFYAVAALFGASRAFYGPASQSLLPRLVSTQALPKAIAWTTSAFQAGVIVGPGLGGLLYVFGPVTVYTLCCALFLAVTGAMAAIRMPKHVTPDPSGLSAVQRIGAGLAYVRSQPILLGAISLDLFAVLLGGATALMPVYAHDILHVGPAGLGALRSAVAVGATATGLYLGVRPLTRHTGITMFVCVALFGLATIVFGLSSSFLLSVVALAALGASDMVSMYIRSTLVQVVTPDAMRGRVSSVNFVFIGASNELGEFESGMTASWFGTVPAVVLGGVGTLIVAALWARLFPALRRTDRLTDPTAA